MNACPLPRISLGRRLVAATIALVISGGVWLACLSFFFTHPASDFYRKSGLSPRARSLADHQLDLWATPALRERELQKTRASNAEWDFMGRSFFVWSLANMALTDPSTKSAHLEITDQIIDETTRLESEKGMYFFLMPYARLRPFVTQPARSLFLDGEFALMMAARCLVEPHPRYETLLIERVDNIVQRFECSSRL